MTQAEAAIAPRSVGKQLATYQRPMLRPNIIYFSFYPLQNRRKPGDGKPEVLGFADAELELQSPASGMGRTSCSLEDSGWRRAQ